MKTPSPRTVGELRRLFLDWLRREVEAGRTRPRTLDYYNRQLQQFADHVGDDQVLDQLIPWHLEEHKTGWHSVQAVQRLFNWAQRFGILTHNPFARIERPPLGERRRTLDRAEMSRLLVAASRPFRRFLTAMRHTLARPQELRALTWAQLQPDGKAFILSDFKGRRRRRDGVRVRLIVLDQFMQRMVRRWRRTSAAEDPVFTNRIGRAWTSNALRCAMRGARRRAELVDGGELVVCYTMRHTAATEATARGVRDRQLADLMGHSSTKTTARYQHLRADHLVDLVNLATARPRRGAG